MPRWQSILLLFYSSILLFICNFCCSLSSVHFPSRSILKCVILLNFQFSSILFTVQHLNPKVHFVRNRSIVINDAHFFLPPLFKISIHSYYHLGRNIKWDPWLGNAHLAAWFTSFLLQFNLCQWKYWSCSGKP